MNESGDDGVEIAARVGNGDAAKAVVATEFDDHDGWVEVENVFEAVDAVFTGVAADSGVHNFVVVAAAIETGLEVVRVCEAGCDTIAGCDAVAEAVNHGNGGDCGGVDSE